MTEQEQVYKMMLDIPQTIVAYDANPEGQHLYGEQRLQIAEVLYNKGYGNVSEYRAEIKQLKAKLEAKLTCDFVKTAQKHAVKEFAEKINELLKEYE